MQFFVGIVPPEDSLKRIAAFQRQWAHNLLPDVVEPHITVKSQGGLTPDNNNWLNEVKAVCKNFPSFRVALHNPAWFGEDVLFLNVDSPQIKDLHRKMVKAIGPSDQLIKHYYEMDLYHAHLTLGQTRWGMNREQLEDMYQRTEEALAPYPAFEVDFLRVYQEVEPDRYRTYLDIPLKKG
ncbi:2'-5' RNA ligase family protein [Paenibacillus kobensis]|uniref:2'-5' RNA ligase family protein n=1 Tax=Paenibacillus kobensis TaxID=59841 RepID=UPI000FD997AB|nr:2'-5' RNA ligase family protein [Paenibacillus kobensis]